MHAVCFGIQIDELLLKIPEEKNILEDRKETWAIMADKGFQDAQNRFRAVLPAKNPRNGNLTRAQEIENERIARVRILAENFYGRAIMKFKITDIKYMYDKEMYGLVIRLCFALTNFELMHRPLRRWTDSLSKQFSELPHDIIDK